MESCDVILHLQVAVPPSAKSLNWFCCQPKSSGVFPQFFISKEKDNQTLRSLSLGGVRGVFGIGAAIIFKGSSCASREWSSLGRLISSSLSLSELNVPLFFFGKHVWKCLWNSLFMICIVHYGHTLHSTSA